MYYIFTGIDTHLDFGFGITAESYYYSAKYLYENIDEIQDAPQNEMPVSFLYRHSIELFLKSLIVVFHKQLKVNYGSESFDSKKPKILIKGEWKNLYDCHLMDELYNYWLKELFLKHRILLEEIAPNGDWQEDTSVSQYINLICNYDNGGSFFRYPITKNVMLDLKKYAVKKLDDKKINELFIKGNSNERKKGREFMVIKNDNEEIINSFAKDENVLVDVTKALKEVSEFFSNFHTKTRVLLCDGY